MGLQARVGTRSVAVNADLTFANDPVNPAARQVAELDPDGRHSLRIHVKKLRYASEFFMSLFPGKKKSKRAFLASLNSLQTALGDVNDIAVRAGLKAVDPRRIRLAFLSQKHNQFAYFSMQLGESDWSQKDVLDFGGNVGNILRSASASTTDIR